jgi:multicomponent Na+:H+ antiporter subunit B
MSERLRHGVFGLGVLLFGALFGFATYGLPEFGVHPAAYADLVNELAQARHVANASAAVLFDFRGFDTLGEELILLVCVLGVARLFEAEREDEDRKMGTTSGHQPERHSLAVYAFGESLLGLVLLFGGYVMVHGVRSAGGGFQGGVIMATAIITLYITTTYGLFKKIDREEVLEPVEGVAAGLYILIGLAAWTMSGVFLLNVLPLGTPGSLFGGGTIWLLNLVVGLKVGAAVCVLAYELLKETQHTEPKR